MGTRVVDTEEVNPYSKYKHKDGIKLEGVSPVFNEYLSTLPQEYQDMILITDGIDQGLRTQVGGKHYNPDSKHIDGSALDLKIHDKKGGGYNDKLYNYFLNDPKFKEMGFSMPKPDHGTAPHIHMQLNKEVKHEHEESPIRATIKSTVQATRQPDTYSEYIGGFDYSVGSQTLITDKSFQEATIDEIYGRTEDETAEKERGATVSTAQAALVKEQQERKIAVELIDSLELGFYSDNQT